jgi:hypothetical protein
MDLQALLIQQRCRLNLGPGPRLGLWTLALLLLLLPLRFGLYSGCCLDALHRLR